MFGESINIGIRRINRWKPRAWL